MFPSSFYAELDPIYRKELLQLVKRIEEIEKKGGKGSRKKVFELLNEFSSKYLMTKNLWIKKKEMVKGFIGLDTHQIASEYVFHFGDLSDLDRKILNVHNVRHKKFCNSAYFGYGFPRELSLEETCYPHEKMEEKWRRYEICVAKSIIPKAVYQRYEKMKDLYYKIVAIEYDTEKWTKVLTEANDYEFFVDNVENRLNENLGNKELWKLYIQYLQTNGHYKKLLETYSKYCRYFLEDSKMLKEYKKAAEKFGPSLVPWKNTKSFEIYDKNFFNVSEIFAPPVTVAAPTCHFNPKTTSSQIFPFKQSLLNYIIENAKASVLFDLFKTCKWFYANFPVEIIYSFDASIRNRGSIRKQSIKISHLNRLKLDNKIYVSTVFSFCFRKVNALKNFISNIYRCSAKIIIIKNQHLTFNELKFLIGHGKVVELNLSVKDENGNPFKFEDIIVLLPKIQRLDIQDTVCSPNISQILCDFPFQKKFKEFYFGEIEILPDPNAFAEFILKNASPTYDSEFSFYISLIQNDDQKFDNDEEENMDFNVFKSIVNNIIDEKWKGLKRPSF